MFDCPTSPCCNLGTLADKSSRLLEQSQDFVVVDVGTNGQDWTVESMAKILSKAGTDLIVIAVDYEGSDDSQTHGELVDHVVSHCYVSGGRSKQCTA